MKCQHGIFATLGLLAFGLASFADVGGAAALDYPTRPVHWIVGYPAGGSTDIVARLMGQYLSEKLGQQFIIENRPGAGNNIGTEAVVRAPADGYTLLLINPANAINTTLYQNLNFDFIRDIAPVAGFIRVPNVMEVNPSVPAKRWPSSLPTPKPIPARSTWLRPAAAPQFICPASCSR
jgi:tripartite-type tricarboxylate transporter receptor subunit TctC